ncbi:MAG: hypothetical protein U0W94_02710 [Buchnera aphidicola (Schlechtendalia peitan)]
MEYLYFWKQSKKKITPIAHLPGTTLTILDLFFNKPARRKYIKSEYSEFMKIDEIVRRLSLSSSETSVCLKHNEKLIRYYHMSESGFKEQNRVDAICGYPFTQNAIFIKNEYNNMSIYGWIYIHTTSKFLSKKVQYFYINKRIINNNVVRHSIVQAIQEIHIDVNKISYILHFFICPNELDINVHPEKKQVNILNVRIVHGFLYQSILFFMKKRVYNFCNLIETSEWVIKNKISSGTNTFSKKKCLNNTCLQKSINILDEQSNIMHSVQKNCKNLSSYKSSFFKKCPTIFGNLLTLVNKNYLLIEKNEQLFLLSLSMAKRLVYKSKLKLGIRGRGIQLEYFDVPYCVIVNQHQLKVLYVYKKLLSHIGLNYFLFLNSIQIRSIPSIFINESLNDIIVIILCCLTKKKEIKLSELIKNIFNNFKINILHWNDLQIIALFSEFKQYCFELISDPVPELLQVVNISLALSLLGK